MRRELQRNAQLRQVCGFELWLGREAVPTASAYSRFLGQLIKKYRHYLVAIFDELKETLTEPLPYFGQDLAIDGKAISSFAKRKSKGEPDDRRDLDGNRSKKSTKEFVKMEHRGKR